MKCIWKYILGPYSEQSLQIPKDSTILSVDSQGSKLCLWAMVDPDKTKEYRVFEVFGTGLSIPPGNRTFIGTCKLDNDTMIFHVFEKH